MIELIGLDIDGTLVGESGSLSAAVLAAIEASARRGQHLAVVTARPAFGVSWEIAALIGADGWHVFQAGATVVHRSSVDVHAEMLSDAQVDALIRLAERHGWVWEAYGPRSYVTDSDDPLAVAHAKLLGVPHERKPLHDLGEEVARIQYVIPEDQTPVAISELPRGVTAGGAGSPMMPGVTFLSITRTGVSKAHGLKWIASRLGVGIGQVMMVGDGHNDIDAIRAAGVGVAMGDAAADVMEAADYVVGSVHEDGVVEALELSQRL